MRGKKIQVKAASAQHQEAEIKTVEIRGLEAEDETEMCLLYFDNPRKGGGAIEDSRWDALDKLFYITFADAAGMPEFLVSLCVCVCVFVCVSGR